MAIRSPAARSKKPSLESPPDPLGGMSERPKERGCKPCGSAYAGSNPAPPTNSHARVKPAHLFAHSDQLRLDASEQPAVPAGALAPKPLFEPVVREGLIVEGGHFAVPR